ncbi:MAG: ChbG/HpnK family deacetylase [Pelolinea sp.]|nr:ChbG/HpnK family deacetylase [Pelolinea sp.]
MKNNIEPTQNKYLIIQADDFGMSRGINRGVIDAFQSGAATSTSLLMVVPFAEEAARLARENPHLPVGLHLSLTNGYPILSPKEIPSLVDQDGALMRRPELILPVAKSDDIVRELTAQLNRFLQYGLKLSHIDTHHDCINHPTVRKFLLDMAEKHSVPIRSLTDLEAKEEAKRRGILNPDWYDTIFTKKIPITPSFIIEKIKSLKPGITDLGCHLGYADEDLAAISSYVKEREMELESLKDKRVMETLISEGVRLIGFNNLRDIKTVLP